MTSVYSTEDVDAVPHRKLIIDTNVRLVTEVEKDKFFDLYLEGISGKE